MMSDTPGRLTLHHDKLKTTFTGVLHPYSLPKSPVVQYRGIKFASIPARWRQSKLFEAYPASYDAMKYGPSCPQGDFPAAEDVMNGFEEQKLGEIKIYEPLRFDEYECLNLNITGPVNVTEGDELPVMICIHGGGQLAGRNSSWFNDGGAFVAQSIELGKPVVFVSINYRLGPLGWLASSELLEDNRKVGDQGVGNYALNDIHLGIEWVFRNITPFGGDPENITIVGESAGSHNVMAQIHCLLPGRFHRAICQSGVIGTPTMCRPPSTLEEQENLYVQCKIALKVDTLEELRQVAAASLPPLFRRFQIPTTLVSRPTIDGVHYNASWEDHNASVREFGFDLLIGDVSHEYTILEAAARARRRIVGGPESEKPMTTSQLVDKLSDFVAEEKTLDILSAYGIHRRTPQKEVLPGLWYLLEDCNFIYASESYALTSVRKGARVYRYLFDERNPFGGLSHQSQQSNHALDLAYLYGPPSIFSSTDHADWETIVQKDIQEKWIRFSYGEKIWKPLNDVGYYAFGPGGQVGEIDKSELARRRRIKQWNWADGLNAEQSWNFATTIGKHATSLL